MPMDAARARLFWRAAANDQKRPSIRHFSAMARGARDARRFVHGLSIVQLRPADAPSKAANPFSVSRFSRLAIY
jgi:hypothetical protein